MNTKTDKYKQQEQQKQPSKEDFNIEYTKAVFDAFK